MSSFFQNMADNNLFADWANTFDWLFDDAKFEPQTLWSRGAVRALTNRIRKLPYFSEGHTYQHGPIKSLAFPDKTNVSICAIFSGDSSESKSFIKHIRNGIAHGKARCFRYNGGLFVEIEDFDKRQDVQTAYMCFPLSYIANAHRLYCNVKKSYENSKKSNSRSKT